MAIPMVSKRFGQWWPDPCVGPVLVYCIDIYVPCAISSIFALFCFIVLYQELLVHWYVLFTHFLLWYKKAKILLWWVGKKTVNRWKSLDLQHMYWQACRPSQMTYSETFPWRKKLFWLNVYRFFFIHLKLNLHHTVLCNGLVQIRREAIV